MSKRISIYHNNTWVEKHEGTKKLVSIPQVKNTPISKFLLEKLKIKDNESLIVLFAGYTDTNVKSIIKYLKFKGVKKAYFIIEDVFRIISPDNASWLETYPIEKYPNEVESIELNIIFRICKKSNIIFEIYHCEYNCEIFSKKYNIDIKYYDWFSSSVGLRYYNSKEDFEKKFKNKISCFNLRPDWHRYLIGILLKDNSDVILSLNHTCSTTELLENKALPLEKFSLDLKNKILEANENVNYRSLLWDGSPKELKKNNVINLSPIQQQKTISPIKNSFVNLVTETRFSSPMPCFNEKTLKPISVFRPFIMLGPPGTLKLLKELGFKTFDKWWDESYDAITDHNKRFETVYNLVKEILKKNKEDLSSMLNEMSEILIHNQKQLQYLFQKTFKE